MNMDAFFNGYGVVVAGIIGVVAESGNAVIDGIITVLSIVYILFCFVVKIRNFLRDNDAESAAKKIQEKAKELAEKNKEESKDDGGL